MAEGNISLQSRHPRLRDITDRFCRYRRAAAGLPMHWRRPAARERRARLPAWLAAAAVAAGVGGCSAQDSPENRFDDYLARLARTLDEPLPPATGLERLRYPAKRRLRLEIETPRTGWIGFMQLHRCGLINLVSRRNSILGRIAPPHRRLAYEATLLARLRRCRTELAATADSDDADFRARLDRLIAIKADALPRLFWNLTWASDAITGLFSVADSGLGLAPDAVGREPRLALMRLAHAGRRLAAGNALDQDRLTSIYQTLDASPYGGQLQIAALRASVALEQATAMLEQRLARRPICFNQQPNRRGRTLQTVLLEIYGPRIQSYLADLTRAGREWRAATAALIDAQNTPLPVAFRDYRAATLAADSGVWQRFGNALTRHTEHWQRALRQCDLMPGD